MKLNVPFTVVCINDAERPNDIPISKWVVKGKEYTVIKIDRMLLQGGAVGFQLAEIDLRDCVPYLYFSAHRFGIKPLPDMAREVEVEVRDSEMIMA